MRIATDLYVIIPKDDLHSIHRKGIKDIHGGSVPEVVDYMTVLHSYGVGVYFPQGTGLLSSTCSMSGCHVFSAKRRARASVCVRVRACACVGVCVCVCARALSCVHSYSRNNCFNFSLNILWSFFFHKRDAVLVCVLCVFKL